MIFLLDDDPIVLRVLSEVLRDVDAVKAASLWSELGTDLIRTAQPSLLVCDLEMPGIDGAEFCSIVRRFRPTLPIVLFSASARAPELAPGLVVDAVVSKREGPQELRRKVIGLHPSRAAIQERLRSARPREDASGPAADRTVGGVAGRDTPPRSPSR